jgi:hypothetical protein
MNRQMVNLKLDRSMVIRKVTEKISLLKTKADEIKKQEATYEKELQKYYKECEAIIKKGNIGIKEIYTRSKYEGGCDVEVTYLFENSPILPTKPVAVIEKPSKVILNTITELENMRTLLVMCTDETISSKVHSDLIKYILD